MQNPKGKDCEPIVEKPLAAEDLFQQSTSQHGTKTLEVIDANNNDQW